MVLSNKGFDLLTRLEGLRLEAYQDEAGIWTIGYGHTGDDVYEGLVISEDEADLLLYEDLRRFEQAVNDNINTISQNQFDAFVLLAFNIGVGGFEKSSALRLHLAGESKYIVANRIKAWKYVTINGEKVVSKGLVKRRNAESCVYVAANYTNWV